MECPSHIGKNLPHCFINFIDACATFVNSGQDGSILLRRRRSGLNSIARNYFTAASKGHIPT
ncbi:hypothetical protein ACPOL_1203 [Acidisarcina polymorpha]|uniref:Uncharacterized protein n=1 Tax=Acidisarcina polymorpha TaxID=2211140 RepID=A0A2Z5FUL4_9BACT|nr:hypothetical protein ACPOL_1203 [Acidisarcina polymorpha]